MEEEQREERGEGERRARTPPGIQKARASSLEKAGVRSTLRGVVVETGLREGGGGGQGLGVTLRWLGLSQLAALGEGKTLVVGGRWRAFNFEGCDRRGLWCYLRHVTACKVPPPLPASPTPRPVTTHASLLLLRGAWPLDARGRGSEQLAP